MVARNTENVMSPFFDNGIIAVSGVGVSTGRLLTTGDGPHGKFTIVRLGYVDKMTGDTFVDCVLTRQMLSVLLEQLCEVADDIARNPDQYP